MEGLRVTHVGGPTVLIERAGWALLTDPTFDPAGGTYRFGWGTGSRKTAGPAIAPADLPPLDAVLLTHDHHGDNLDAAGRALLSAAGAVVTTEGPEPAGWGTPRAAWPPGRRHASRPQGGRESRSPRRRAATARPAATRSSAMSSASRSRGTARTAAPSKSPAIPCCSTARVAWALPARPEKPRSGAQDAIR